MESNGNRDIQASKLNSIIIITGAAFPIGYAQTKRKKALASGFIANGYHTTVLITRPTEAKIINNQSIKGVHDGIEYFYTCKRTVKPGNIFHRALLHGVGIANAVKYITNLKGRSNCLCIWSNSTGVFATISFYITSKIIGSVYVHEINEHPEVFLNRFIFFKYFALLKFRLIFKFFDVIFCISEPLLEYIEKRKRKDAIATILPIVAELPKKPFPKYTEKRNDIVYIGNLIDKKDGIFNLIHSFKIAHDYNTELHLIMIGEGPDKIQCENLAKTLSIDKHVVFTGYLYGAALEDMIYNAALLVLNRPNNLQARFGLPTKLAEYLLTGIPVVVTNVGDISKYLLNEYSSFIVENDLPDTFARGIISALSNPNLGKIGLQGQLIAEQYFHPVKNALHFINTILNWRSNRDFFGERYNTPRNMIHEPSLLGEKESTDSL